MTNEVHPEQLSIYDMRFHKVTARRYFSKRKQAMQTRIDIDSKSIEGMGVAMSIQQAEEMVAALQKAIIDAQKMTPPEDDEVTL